MARKKKLPPNIRERDGRYTYRYSVDVVENGKVSRKQKETPSYATVKEAQDAGIIIEANRLNGKMIDIKSTTLADWFRRFIKDYSIERELRSGTVRNLNTAYNRLEKHFGGNTKVRNVTPYDYQMYLNALKSSNLKKGTVQEYHNSARTFFSQAVKKGIISNDPTKDARIPAYKITVEEIESGKLDIPLFLEKKQLKNLLGVIRFRGNAQDYNIFLTLAYTGLRIGELLALKDTDFDEVNGIVSVTKTLTVLSSVRKYTIGPPKNKTSIRKVTIGSTVIKALKSQITWRDQKKADGRLIHDAGFIFISTKYLGYPASPDYAQEKFKHYLKLAKLSEDLTPHSLRHTHTSLLAEAGEQLAVIQERLGHKNDDITRKIYLHVTENQRKAVPDKFEFVMNS